MTSLIDSTVENSAVCTRCASLSRLVGIEALSPSGSPEVRTYLCDECGGFDAVLAASIVRDAPNGRSITIDTPITDEIAQAMSEAFMRVCDDLKRAGIPVQRQAIASRIAALAYSGTKNANALVEETLAYIQRPTSPK